MKVNDILYREEALKQIWGRDDYFTARSMDVFITKLRKYLKDDPNLEIVNIHGNGFRLNVERSNGSVIAILVQFFCRLPSFSFC